MSNKYVYAFVLLIAAAIVLPSAVSYAYDSLNGEASEPEMECFIVNNEEVCLEPEPDPVRGMITVGVMIAIMAAEIWLIFKLGKDF